VFQGAFTALVTPFKNGQVDYRALEEYIEWQIAQGIDGLVSCGTTGESATLTHEEHNEVNRRVLLAAKGRVPVMAGTGSNSTAEAIALTRAAQNSGADAALMVTPYYNKPSQEGIFRHYKAVAEQVSMPILVYNVPARTGVNLLPETVARLTEISNIVGIKEASGSLDQVKKIREFCPGLDVFCGEDALTVEMMALGAKGVISVTANVVPADVKKMVSLALKGKIDEARKMQQKLMPLHGAMFLESNPQPVKVALKMLGRGNGEFRLPLWGLSPENEEKLRAALKAYGLLQ
jgi:4-hydroxy-tetrahydrodipicolinate synthase